MGLTKTGLSTGKTVIYYYDQFERLRDIESKTTIAELKKSPGSSDLWLRALQGVPGRDECSMEQVKMAGLQDPASIPITTKQRFK